MAKGAERAIGSFDNVVRALKGKGKWSQDKTRVVDEKIEKCGRLIGPVSETYRTANFTLPFNLIGVNRAPKNKIVARGGQNRLERFWTAARSAAT